MLDLKDVGKSFEPVVASVEKGRLINFAKSIAEDNPIYTDELAAKKAGYDSLPVPPTFLFCLKMDVPKPFENYQNIGVSLEKLLHANQSFTYFKSAVVGDELTFYSNVEDIYAKKGGALEFLIEKTKVENQSGEHVADLETTLVIRN
ncbi:MAG: acyl dehydratase [Alteromonas sp.]|jgi:acyl dehydratase|uniref:Dehydratase n=1 Tax=Paraglaciecola chathamensis TaxID=368405 RepID=A0A8H9IGD3_9ALTE|nr:MaoC family dehydratase N-terminal domain-containing protein [Paraglaciecola oceanifecundans]MAI65025.1 acyl dehydratase [Alteromonas sp.]GGZ83769.1 dehydratase [Paraglaciecola oceanifecundans]|tara:strand:+ start:6263 stop:6703 length:441 start_codon:yes stop_codon:yes gene_type:complete